MPLYVSKTGKPVYVYGHTINTTPTEVPIQNLHNKFPRDIALCEETVIQKVVEKPVVHTVEKEVVIPVQKVVEKIVEVPVYNIIEKRVEVEVPVEKIVEREVQVDIEKIVQVPVEKVVEKLVEVPVEHIVEKKMEIPIIKVVERKVEIPVERIEAKRDEDIIDVDFLDENFEETINSIEEDLEEMANAPIEKRSNRGRKKRSKGD